MTDDYRARFKSWKSPIKGELTIQAHPNSIEAFMAEKARMEHLVSEAKRIALERQWDRIQDFNPFAGGYIGPKPRKSLRDWLTSGSA